MATQLAFRSKHWEDVYMIACFETDNEHLSERIRDAEEAVSFRLGVMTNRNSDAKELQALENALKGLNTLRRERLNHAGNVLNLR